MQAHRIVSGIFIDTFLEIEKLVILMRIVKTFSKVSQFSEIAAKNYYLYRVRFNSPEKI